MAKKMLFIFNPNSGKGKIKEAIYDIIERFTRAGCLVTACQTLAPNDCTEKISELAQQYDVAVIAGGDGTLSEAVAGMMTLPEDKRIPVGYIPTGTMNDFASSNNISPFPLDAVNEIIENDHAPYDIGTINGKHFMYVAAFGVFTDVSYATPQVNKNIFGPAAYIFEGIKSLAKIKGIDVDITTDTGENVKTTASLVLIMNSASVAGFEFGKFYDVDTADGKFEIIVIDYGVNIINLPTLVSDIRSGKTEMNGITILSASSATVKTSEPAKWTLDGEYGGEADEVSFHVKHKAMRFFISRK